MSMQVEALLGLEIEKTCPLPFFIFLIVGVSVRAKDYEGKTYFLFR